MHRNTFFKENWVRLNLFAFIPFNVENEIIRLCMNDVIKPAIPATNDFKKVNWQSSRNYIRLFHFVWFFLLDWFHVRRRYQFGKSPIWTYTFTEVICLVKSIWTIYSNSFITRWYHSTQNKLTTMSDLHVKRQCEVFNYLCLQLKAIHCNLLRRLISSFENQTLNERTHATFSWHSSLECESTESVHIIPIMLVIIESRTSLELLSKLIGLSLEDYKGFFLCHFFVVPKQMPVWHPFSRISFWYVSFRNRP